MLKKVGNIDTTGFVLKTTYDTDKSDLKKMQIKKLGCRQNIPNTSDLAKKTDLNTRIPEAENEISSITGLATNSALAAVENKIPDVSSLVKKTDYDAKISDIQKKITDHDYDKYITTPEFNILAVRIFNARLAQASLITKTNFDTRLQSLSEGITSYKTKYLIYENELKKIRKI